MGYTLRDPEQAAHIASAHHAYAQLQASAHALRAFGHEFVLSKNGEVDHLLKVVEGQVVRDFGPRTEPLQRMVSSYETRRADAQSVHAHWQAERGRVQNLNRARQVGRLLQTPVKVLEVLEVLRRHGIMDCYTVIGTYAMYAYEAAAGVVFDEPTMATNDVDLFYTADTQMRLAALVFSPLSMVDVLREADPTFDRNEDQKESAMNSAGFSVDFLRREETEQFTEAYSISGMEGDIYPVKARRSSKFLGSPVFEQVVIAVDGSMTMMRTIDPRTFMEFKQWMSVQKDRDPLKRGRDHLQALAIGQLLQEGRLVSRLA